MEGTWLLTQVDLRNNIKIYSRKKEDQTRKTMEIKVDDNIDESENVNNS